MNDTTFKLRVPTADLEHWRERARAEGKSLAEWIRGRCGIVIQSPEHFKEVTGRDYKPGEGVKFERAPKTCAHGVEKGWRCTLCRGVVK